MARRRHTTLRRPSRQRPPAGLRVASAALLAASVLAAGGLPSPAGAAAREDQIVVRHRVAQSLGERAELRAAAGVTLDERLPLAGVDIVATAGDLDGAISALRRDPDVLWAEPNRAVQAYTADPLFEVQWSLQNTGLGANVLDADIDAPEAWTVSRGLGVTVGVVDTGVDPAHPDLAGQLVFGKNFVGDGHLTAMDGSGHGTHVAGIIAAAENTIGLVGVAPAAKVQALRALPDAGAGSEADVALAFDSAGASGLRVVNASLGSANGYPSVEAQAIAAHPNTLYVVASGNRSVDLDPSGDYPGGESYPCKFRLPNVLCVGATDSLDGLAAFSNTGSTSVDLLAPGVSIISTLRSGQYGYESGTSMASPMVAGAAALVAAAHPSWTAVEIKAALLGTVDQPAGLEPYSLTGGRLNVARAVGVDVGLDGRAPRPVQGLVATGADHRIDLAWTRSPELDIAQYTVQRAGPGGWTTVATLPSELAATSLPGLAPGTQVRFRVLARDHSGEVSLPSQEATAVAAGIDPPPPPSIVNPPAPPTVVAPPPATTPVVVAPDAVRLTKVRLVLRRGRPHAVGLRLSDRARVSVTAVRRRAKGLRARTVHRSLLLASGRQQIPIGRGKAALDLNRGTWRVTVRAGGHLSTITIRLR